ncbi:MAG: hypothetical protein A4E19_20015 [Nitrospira sp. SG-bin1]|nr:MAG: hypothetical protein A4E19_20015 [Nitrospira sp. SG-bin1]
MLEITISLCLAFLAIWGLMAFAGERSGWQWGMWPALLLFFLAILVGGLWLAPLGPPFVGVYWLPFGLVALFITLFWVAMPPPPRRKRGTEIQNAESTAQSDTPATETGIGIWFWLLVLGLIVAAFFRYAAYVSPVAQAS